MPIGNTFPIFSHLRTTPSDPDSNKSGKVKKFWSFVKSLKKGVFGITSLRENGILKTDTKEKADSKF